MTPQLQTPACLPKLRACTYVKCSDMQQQQQQAYKKLNDDANATRTVSPVAAQTAAALQPI
jgi:hypothetical protein